MFTRKSKPQTKAPRVFTPPAWFRLCRSHAYRKENGNEVWRVIRRRSDGAFNLYECERRPGDGTSFVWPEPRYKIDNFSTAINELRTFENENAQNTRIDLPLTNPAARPPHYNNALSDMGVVLDAITLQLVELDEDGLPLKNGEFDEAALIEANGTRAWQANLGDMLPRFEDFLPNPNRREKNEVVDAILAPLSAGKKTKMDRDTVVFTNPEDSALSIPEGADQAKLLEIAEGLFKQPYTLPRIIRTLGALYYAGLDMKGVDAGPTKESLDRGSHHCRLNPGDFFPNLLRLFGRTGPALYERGGDVLTLLASLGWQMPLAVQVHLMTRTSFEVGYSGDYINFSCPHIAGVYLARTNRVPMNEDQTLLCYKRFFDTIEDVALKKKMLNERHVVPDATLLTMSVQKNESDILEILIQHLLVAATQHEGSRREFKNTVSSTRKYAEGAGQTQVERYLKHIEDNFDSLVQQTAKRLQNAKAQAAIDVVEAAVPTPTPTRGSTAAYLQSVIKEELI